VYECIGEIVLCLEGSVRQVVEASTGVVGATVISFSWIKITRELDLGF
jgi:hypothetical protein